MSESWRKDEEEDKVRQQVKRHEESVEGMHGHRQSDELECDSKFADLLGHIRDDRKWVDGQIQREYEAELENRLDQALRNGHANGRRSSVTTRRKRISLQMGIAAVCLMLMLTAFVRISPAFAAIVKEIPGFGRFVELVSYDRSLMTALDHEYFQFVNQSDERNGYKFTVNGVLADSQRIVLLYTAEGPGIREENMTFLPYKLKDESGEDLQAMIGSSHFFRDATEKEGVVQDYLDIRMSPGETIPKTLGVMMQLGDEWLEVSVPIDHEKFAELEETFELNESIEVAGQRLTITGVTITPLQVIMNFAADPGNSMRINDLIDMRLVDERGRSYTSHAGMGNWDHSFTSYFQVSSFQKAKSLTLKAGGAMMSAYGLEAIIDTEKQELLHAPDSNLILAGVTKRSEFIDLKFELLQNDSQVMRGYTLFSSDRMIKDGAGRSFPLKSGDSLKENHIMLRTGENGFTGTYYYHIPNKDYVQPLSLEIHQYPGYVMQDISVRIK